MFINTGTVEAPRSALPPHPGLAEALQILQELSPVPKTTAPRSRKRKTETAQIITSSPFKNQLENNKNKKRIKKNVRVASKKPSSNTSKKTTKNKKVGISAHAATMSCDTTPSCCICAVRYCDPPFDEWQQCPTCSGWYHVSCGPDDSDTAVCYKCLDRIADFFNHDILETACSVFPT